eukprot:3620407-Prymnesium_polylepis.1
MKPRCAWVEARHRKSSSNRSALTRPRRAGVLERDWSGATRLTRRSPECSLQKWRHRSQISWRSRPTVGGRKLPSGGTPAPDAFGNPLSSPRWSSAGLPQHL